MAKKRRFRIRTKHYERLMMILILAACLVIGRAFYMKRRQAAGRSIASASSSTSVSSPAAIGAISNLIKARRALGNDDFGKLAYKILLRNIASPSAKADWTIAKLCISDDYCPVPVAQLYKRALSRLATGEFAYARLNLQAQLLKSNLDHKTKRSILEMALSQNASAPATNSAIGADGKMRLSPVTDYDTLTLVQLESLKPPPQQFVQTALQVARNSTDPIGKKYLAQTLAKSYPQFRVEILAQARQMGMNLAGR